MVKWISEWTTDPEVGVQVQMSKKEILENSVKCVVEGLGMWVWKEGATWKIRWEDEGGVGKWEGYESRREENNIRFFFRPPRKTKPLFF